MPETTEMQATVADVRQLAQEILAKLDAMTAAFAEAKDLGREFVRAAEGANWPRLMHAAMTEASGLVNDLTDELSMEDDLATIRRGFREYLELVDLAGREERDDA